MGVPTIDARIVKEGQILANSGKEEFFQIQYFGNNADKGNKRKKHVK